MVVFFAVVTPNPVNRAPLKSSSFFQAPCHTLELVPLALNHGYDDVVYMWYKEVQLCLGGHVGQI